MVCHVVSFTGLCQLCLFVSIFFLFFFFKQKTAYEMRISDWSSDVCSSDLAPGGFEKSQKGTANRLENRHQGLARVSQTMAERHRVRKQIGRASCREKVCQYV